MTPDWSVPSRIDSAFPPSVRRSGTTYQRPNGQEASPKIPLLNRHHQPQANYIFYLTIITTSITMLPSYSYTLGPVFVGPSQRVRG